MSDGEADDAGKAVVGYGKPPVERQFRKGVSGNPKGRPRRRPERPSAPTIGELVLKEAYRPIEIRENDKLVKMPMIQAVIRSLGIAAVKGSLRAQMAIASMVEAVERRATEEQHMLLEAAIDYKKSWEEAFEACDRRGEPRPEPVPHPDELVFDARTGGVIYNGPFDDQENAEWERLLARKQQALEEIEHCRKEAKRSRKLRPVLEREIQFEENIHDMIASKFPDKEIRRQPGFNLHDWREREGKLYEIKKRWKSMRSE